MYSQADDIERRKDNYLIILPNSYKDIDGNSGPITDMFINLNELYVNTTYTPYLIPTNAQVLNTTDATNVYIGTGGVLSQSPKPIKNHDVPAGGSTFWKARVSTEYGTIYVDDIAGRVFLLGSNLQDISAIGMRTFWREHGQIEFLTQFKKLLGVNYPKQCLVSEYGVGITSVYDPLHKRVIIHKRDVRLRKEWEDRFVYNPGQLFSVAPGNVWFDNVAFYYQRAAGNPNIVKIHFDDEDYFENKSFTISYSLVTNS